MISCVSKVISKPFSLDLTVIRPSVIRWGMDSGVTLIIPISVLNKLIRWVIQIGLVRSGCPLSKVGNGIVGGAWTVWSWTSWLRGLVGSRGGSQPGLFLNVLCGMFTLGERNLRRLNTDEAEHKAWHEVGLRSNNLKRKWKKNIKFQKY
jgi:hypothetical protein